MTHTENHFFTAGEGKVLFNKKKNTVVGRKIMLPTADAINDYEEIDDTDERAKRYVNRFHDIGRQRDTILRRRMRNGQ